MGIFLAIVLYIHSADLNPKELVEYIFKIHNSVWLKSFVSIGILALAMSTADSELHMAGVLFANDILFKASLTDGRRLGISRLFSIATILLGLQLALYEQNLFKLMMLALSFYTPIVTIPFLMAILGFRPSSKSVFLSMGAGSLVVIAFRNGLGQYLGIISPILPAMLMNLLFLIGSYYILPKVPGTGWVGIKDKTPLLAEKQKKEYRRAERKEFWQKFSLSNCLYNLVPQRDTTFFGLGLYVFVTQAMRFYIGFGKISIFIWLPTTLISILFFFYPMLITRYQLPTVEKIFSYIYPFLLWLIFLYLAVICCTSIIMDQSLCIFSLPMY